MDSGRTEVDGVREKWVRYRIQENLRGKTK